jgi:hypothetical protein
MTASDAGAPAGTSSARRAFSPTNAFARKLRDVLDDDN